MGLSAWSMTEFEHAPSRFERLGNGDVRFVASNGAAHVVSVLADDIVRARFWPNGAPNPHMRRTWSVVDKANHCPVEGHDRLDLDGLQRWARPGYELKREQADQVTLTTGTLELRLSARTDAGFTIQWCAGGAALTGDTCGARYPFHVWSIALTGVQRHYWVRA